jgi:hypothetical protein
VCGNFYRDGAELGITRIPAGRAAPDAGTSPSTGTEDFKQTIGGNIADLARVGKGGSALPTLTPDRARWIVPAGRGLEKLAKEFSISVSCFRNDISASGDAAK